MVTTTRTVTALLLTLALAGCSETPETVTTTQPTNPEFPTITEFFGYGNHYPHNLILLNLNRELVVTVLHPQCVYHTPLNPAAANPTALLNAASIDPHTFVLNHGFGLTTGHYQQLTGRDTSPPTQWVTADRTVRCVTRSDPDSGFLNTQTAVERIRHKWVTTDPTIRQLETNVMNCFDQHHLTPNHLKNRYTTTDTLLEDIWEQADTGLLTETQEKDLALAFHICWVKYQTRIEAAERLWFQNFYQNNRAAAQYLRDTYTGNRGTARTAVPETPTN